MTEAWKQWVGQIVEGKFPLRQYLGGSDHSGVFQTEYGDGDPQKAAIKLIPADSSSAELQLSRWQIAAKLSHPHLMQLFHMGRCQLAGTDLLYAVMEYAEEDLSQILPHRPLNPDEARDMLKPVLDALVYLHGKGFVHGHIKPANILAAGDQLKLSSDTLCRTTESSAGVRQPGPYDAPEVASTGISPAGDAWSLGMTLVEGLTQHLPVWQTSHQADPVVPHTLPAPFLEITRNALRRDTKRRWKIADIAARLNPSAPVPKSQVSASTAPSPPVPASKVDPLSVPLSPVPPAHGLSDLPVPSRPVGKQSPMARWQKAPPKPRSIVPFAAVALALAAILIVPRLLNHRPEARPNPSMASTRPLVPQPAPQTIQAPVKSKPQPKSEQRQAPAETSQSPQQLAQPSQQDSSLKAASEKVPASLGDTRSAAPSEPQPVAKSHPDVTKTKGEVLDQVLPDVSEKARATIQGKLRISVRVHVDASGSVTAAELDIPASSKYFADLTVQAARRWAFSPPEVDGRSVSSDWILRFEFSQTGTKVLPVQATH